MSEQLLCEIRMTEDPTRQSPGRLTGTLVTYEKRAADRPEMFKAGAFAWADGGIVINGQHDRKAAIVRAIPYMDGMDLKIDTPLLDTQAGRDAATNVRAGLWTGLSSEFHALKQESNRGVREISKAWLSAAALVDSPSYAEATVEVRNRKYWNLDREAIYRWL